MNPFLERSLPVEKYFDEWEKIYPRPYHKKRVDPYTRCRVILMNGTEIEAIFFAHQLHRNCPDNEIRRQVAVSRRLDMQEQKVIAMLKPADETILEHTIGYEQLAVDLTAALAKREKDPNVKMALDFALLEDFDHLYRYCDLANLEYNQKFECLVGHYTEIMPGRPTIAHHRHPMDNVKCAVDFDCADLITKLNTLTITAAEQQTMNYYMNAQNFYPSDEGRKLYQEIGCVEEEHVTQYGGLLDPSKSWLENLLLHKYNECYLYYSCMMTETDPGIKNIWEWHFEKEVAMLHSAASLLEKYDGKCWQQVIPNAEFPQLLHLRSNIEYVRDVLKNTVDLTSKLESYTNVCNLSPNDPFYQFQEMVNGKNEEAPSHKVVERLIRRKGMDYRYEIAPNPIRALRTRTQDNTSVGRYC